MLFLGLLTFKSSSFGAQRWSVTLTSPLWHQAWAELDPSHLEWLHVPWEILTHKYTACCVQSRASCSLQTGEIGLKIMRFKNRVKYISGQLSSAPWLWSGFQFGSGGPLNPISKLFSAPWRARHLLDRIKSDLRLPETPQKYWWFSNQAASSFQMEARSSLTTTIPSWQCRPPSAASSLISTAASLTCIL